jgi:hypothetical protein
MPVTTRLSTRIIKYTSNEFETMNTDKCKRYRDVWIAPGTDMFAALEAGDMNKAAEIYERCEREAAALRSKPTQFVTVTVAVRK